MKCCYCSINGLPQWRGVITEIDLSDVDVYESPKWVHSILCKNLNSKTYCWYKKGERLNRLDHECLHVSGWWNSRSDISDNILLSSVFIFIFISAILCDISCNWWVSDQVTIYSNVNFYPKFFYSIQAIFGTIYVHFIMSSRHQSQTTHHQPSNVLYNATCAPLFDLPKPINNTTHLSIIFGRTVDGVLLQIIDFSFRDLILPWLRWVTASHSIRICLSNCTVFLTVMWSENREIFRILYVKISGMVFKS